MKLNHNDSIHCFECNKDYFVEEIFVNFLYIGSISCPKNHLIGNEWDKEWIYLTSPCSLLYFQYNKLMCKCVDEETPCNGIIDECYYKLGRQSYLDDLKEKNE